MSRPSSTTHKLGRYELVAHLATGGMAEIFLARERGLAGLERLVVIKRILPQLAHDTSFVDMFLREARIIARLNHPNIIQIYELGAEAGDYFIAMEYVHGSTVREVQLLAERARVDVPISVAVSIVEQACRGLHAAHELKGLDGTPLGLIHRDVSPHNLMCSTEGFIKLLDFGVAKASQGSDATHSGHLKGKFAYMSPEQCLGKTLDRRADIFSLGAVIWEFLTGERLFKRERDLDMMRAVIHEKTRPPSKFNPSVPSAIDQVVLRALHKEREQRYQSADEMRGALLEVCRAQKIRYGEDILAKFLGEVAGEELAERQVTLRGALERSLSAREQESLLHATSSGSYSSLSKSNHGPISAPTVIERPHPGSGSQSHSRSRSQAGASHASQKTPARDYPSPIPTGLDIDSSPSVSSGGPAEPRQARPTRRPSQHPRDARRSSQHQQNQQQTSQKPSKQHGPDRAHRAKASAHQPPGRRPTAHQSAHAQRSVEQSSTPTPSPTDSEHLSGERGDSTSVARAKSRAHIWRIAVVIAGILAILLAIFFAIPGLNPGLADDGDDEDDAAILLGDPLKIGWAPIAPEELVAPEVALMKPYLERTIRQPVTMEVAPSYEVLSERLRDGTYDIAVLPPLLYVQTRLADSRVRVVAFRQFGGSTSSDALLVTRMSSPIREFEELEGKTFCFTDRDSATGYFLPQTYIRRQGYDPDKFIGEVVWSGEHLQVLRDLLDEKCDVAATYSGSYLSADKFDIPITRIRIFAITGHVPQDTVAARPGLPRSLIRRLEAALIAFDPQKELGTSETGSVLRISGFSKGSNAEFTDLRDAVKFTETSKKKLNKEELNKEKLDKEKLDKE